VLENLHNFRMNASESACLYWSNRYSGFECLNGKRVSLFRCTHARSQARCAREIYVSKALPSSFDISSRSMGWLLVLRNCEHILFLPSAASNHVCCVGRTDCIP
jgi:hypothetical protein